MANGYPVINLTGAMSGGDTQADVDLILSAVNSYYEREALIEELVATCRAVNNVLMQNRALGLCQGTEYVYLVDKLKDVLAKATKTITGGEG